MENYRTQTGYVQTPEGYWVPATHAMGQSGNSLRATSAYGNADYTGRIGGTTGSSGIPLPGQGGPSAMDDAKLEEQRRLAFGSLAQGAGYFGAPFGQSVQNNISGRMSGADAPYTQAVQDRLFSRQADLAAGQEAGARDMIRSQLGERGMEGSGAALAAMLGAGRERSAANTAALSDIQNRAQLENFAARERAQQAGTDFLSQRSSSEAPYRLKEADLRINSEVYGQNDGLGQFGKTIMRALGGGAAGSPQAGQPFGPQVQYPRPAMQQAGGGIKSAMPQQAAPATQATQGLNVNQNYLRNAGYSTVDAAAAARQRAAANATGGGYVPAPTGAQREVQRSIAASPLNPLSSNYSGASSGYDPFSFYSAKGW